MDGRALTIRCATFLGGLYFFLEYLIPEDVSHRWGWNVAHEPITTGFIALGSMAIGLGVLNLLLVHGKRVAFKMPGAVNSLALLTGMLVTLAITVVTWVKGLDTSREVQPILLIGQFAQRILSDEEQQTKDRRPIFHRTRILIEDGDLKVKLVTDRIASLRTDVSIGEGYLKESFDAAALLRTDLAALATTLSSGDAQILKSQLLNVAASAQKTGSSYRNLLLKHGEIHWSQKLYAIVYDGLFVPLGSAMFALLGVYIAAAAFRAFRVRSLESSFLMVAAVLVMLGQMSFGEMLSKDLPAIRQWLLEVPNSAAFRAIRFGAGLAGLLLSIRMWLSIESRSFSGDKS